MICVIKKYVDTFWYWKKKQVLLLCCFLCKKITKKHFFQSKTIKIIGKKTTFSLRLSITYYAFGIIYVKNST